MIEIKHKKTGNVLRTVEGDTLEGADLFGANLEDASLVSENLTGANLSYANLREADLQHSVLSDANLSYAFLFDTNLSVACLTRANLHSAYLVRTELIQTKLIDADLREAKLQQPRLWETDLYGANLSGADLYQANLRTTNLCGADLSNANFMETTFSDCPTLHQAKGLEEVNHHSSSTLDAITLRACVSHLPDMFLRGVGYNQEEIENMRTMYKGGSIKYYSCFIAYRRADAPFAKYLHDQLEAAGVTCWLDEEDMQGGRCERPQIQSAIKTHDKLLLVCSAEAVTRPRVVEEIIAALDAEREGAGQKLFPVRLDDYILGDDVLAVADAKLNKGEWREDWVRCVRAMHIPDFQHWKDHDKFQAQFQRLLRNLKSQPDF